MYHSFFLSGPKIPEVWRYLQYTWDEGKNQLTKITLYVIPRPAVVSCLRIQTDSDLFSLYFRSCYKVFTAIATIYILIFNRVILVGMVAVAIIRIVMTRVRLFNVGLHFLATKVAFSCPSANGFGQKILGLMILGQVKSIKSFCLFGRERAEKRNFWS